MIKRFLIYDVIYFLLLIFCLILSKEFYNHLLEFSIPSLRVLLVCLFLFAMILLLNCLKIGFYEGVFLTFFRFASVYPIIVFSIFYAETLVPLYFSLMFYFIMHILLKLNYFKIKSVLSKTFSERDMFFGILILTISMLTILFANNGLPSFKALNLANVYEVRSEYKSSALIALLQSFTTFFIVPFLIFKSKKKVFLLFPVGISFVIFLSSGGKFIIAMCFVFIALRLILSCLSKSHLPLIFITPLLIASLVLVTDLSFVAHYLYFRPFIVPAWVTMEYFKFADLNGFYFYTDHFFSGLFSVPISLPESVGWQMYPDSGTYANSGVIGYSFVNTGMFPIIEIALIVIVVKLFSYLGRSAINIEDKNLVLALLVILGIYLGTTNILTALKTRMFMAALLAMYFSIKRKRYV